MRRPAVAGFIAVSNIESRPCHVRAGNERGTARLADAAFFWRDRKQPLAARRAALDAVPSSEARLARDKTRRVRRSR